MRLAGVSPQGGPEQRALPAAWATIQSEESKADVAQLVEQLIRNQQVVSSSLTVGSIDSMTYEEKFR